MKTKTENRIPSLVALAMIVLGLMAFSFGSRTAAAGNLQVNSHLGKTLAMEFEKLRHNP